MLLNGIQSIGAWLYRLMLGAVRMVHIKSDLTIEFRHREPFQKMKRIHVLDLDLGPQNFFSFTADRDVGIETQRALFHIAVGSIEIEHDRSNRAGIGGGLFAL